MPYLSCPDCRFRLYRTTVSAPKSCPVCESLLVVHRGGRPEPARSIFRELPPRRVSASVTHLLALQRRIAARVGEGASLGQVDKEIIAPADLARDRRSALRRYARAKLRGRPGRGSWGAPPEGRLG